MSWLCRFKKAQNRFCSYSCAAKNGAKVDWKNIDLVELLKSKSIAQVADELGVSYGAVNKQKKKINQEKAPKSPKTKGILSDSARQKIGEKNAVRQLGSFNSQYGTKWITNEISGEQKKIKKEMSVPNGWLLGRINIQLQKEKEIQKEEQKHYQLIYRVYLSGGFEEVKRQFGYEPTHEHLLKKFSQYVPNYKKYINAVFKSIAENQSSL